MGSNWKLVLVFAVLFLTGGVTGSVITHSLMRRQGLPDMQRNSHRWTDDLIQRLNGAANLTPEQAEKFRPRIESAVKANAVDSDSGDATGR